MNYLKINKNNKINIKNSWKKMVDKEKKVNQIKKQISEIIIPLNSLSKVNWTPLVFVNM